jgi:lysophospholipase L1-like esterase
LAEITPGNHPIMAFGDSLTRGYGDDADGGGTVQCDQTGGYPPRLEALLADRDVDTTIVASAVCGELTADGLSRIDVALNLIRPEVVIIMEGTNDFSHGGSIGIETIVTNVQLMADKVKRRGAVPVVVAPPPRDPEVVNPEFIVDARAAFFAGALETRAEAEGLLFVNQHAVFREIAEDVDLFELYYYDPYHPNADGYDIIAEVMIDQTLEALSRVLYPFDCQDGPEKICLSEDVFQVEVAWKTQLGETGKGKALRLTGDTAHFWFFSPENVELVVKVLDGRTLNDKYWVFYGALSDVEYTITVKDSRSGRSKEYRNAQGTLASMGDTSAFPGDVDGGPTLASEIGEGIAVTGADATTGVDPFGDIAFVDPADVEKGVPAPSCTPSATQICLNNNRFSVRVRWTDPQGLTGAGQATKLTADTGYFWFFSESNIELMLKVLDGRGLNGHFWVFFGSLSNVQFTVNVTDTVTNETVLYQNPPGHMASVADTSAFEVTP